MKNYNPFCYLKTSPEVIRLAVMMYVRFPLSLRNVEDLLHERGINICYKIVRYWWNRFSPLFPAEIRKGRIRQPRSYSNWQWHLDEVCRNLPPFTLPSSTISIFKDTLFQETNSKFNATLHLLNGSSFMLHKQSYPSANRDEFTFV